MPEACKEHPVGASPPDLRLWVLPGGARKLFVAAAAVEPLAGQTLFGDALQCGAVWLVFGQRRAHRFYCALQHRRLRHRVAHVADAEVLAADFRVEAAGHHHAVLRDAAD